MISAELYKQIRYIQITTRRAITSVFAGEYESAFKGQGMEFEDVREYQPGDEIRSIDWNVTARTGYPHVKRYVEERELNILFLVDLSASGSFGSVGRDKNSFAAELVALLAFAAGVNHDRTGLIVFTDEVEFFIPPAKGFNHTLRMVRELLSFRPEGKGTAVGHALEYLGRVTRRRSVVFLISDFFDTGFEKTLRVMAERHDLVALIPRDPMEKTLPDAGMLRIRDPETGRSALIDTSSRKLRAEFGERCARQWERLSGEFRSAGVDYLEVPLDCDMAKVLSRFFLLRESRR